MRVGPYPTRFDMRYTSPTARRALIVAALKVRSGVARSDVKAGLAAIGNPVAAELKERLDATGCIDFLSLSVIETVEGSDESVLLVEVNGDGEDGAVLAAFAEAGSDWLGPVLAACTEDGEPPATPTAMAQLIFDNVIDLHQLPWGNTGLHFDGLSELSVKDIERQRDLAATARFCIDKQMNGADGLKKRPMEILLRVRRMLKQDPYLRRLTSLKKVMDKIPAELRLAIVRPSRRRLQIADWSTPSSFLQHALKMLLLPGARWIAVSLILLWIGLGYGLWAWAMPDLKPNWNDWAWALAFGTVGGAFAALLAFLGIFGLFLLAVRWHEKRDVSDDRIADFGHVEAIARSEDYPGYEQNHIIAVMPFKPGFVRRLSFAFSMWWIKMAVTHWFRPGFVVSMGTIHKARWFRVPGTEQFVFFSNYDGTWESYLEDFITRAHEGQSSAWSHGVGFPPTRWLIFDGASDGDRFKRWVRRQQRPSLCWYSRFPELTTTQIRLNAMIEDGLARAASDTDARRWLAHFGSAQREIGELESQEAQSIVFTGMKRHDQATALLLRLPEDPAQARKWLRQTAGFKRKEPPVKAARRAAGELAHIHFGDVPVSEPALVLGLTASGLERLGLREGRGLEQLPAVFRMGMAGRQRILGDSEAGDWRWSDRKMADNGADAVLFVYGGECSEFETAEMAHRKLVELHIAGLQELGGQKVHEVPCQPTRDEAGNPTPQVEHFGFRDGISQPVIRGSRRSGDRAPERDVVSPGEFLLGYRNDQGYVSPAIGIGAEHDPGSVLPTVAEDKTNRFPFYGNRSSNPDLRDFGRNGAFMVLRQLDQDVEGFQQALVSKAEELEKDYRNLAEFTGGPITPEWVGAKIIGRWKDGSPLVGNPTCPAGLGADQRPDNDFAFGVDDPRGFACPLGSHIRRTNPRDSQEPGDPEEQAITNRHRLLRRGRSYDYLPEGENAPRKGLMFAALCADIERQFEFVQHTWVNASSFHGLSQEADPLLGNPLAKDGAFVTAAAGVTAETGRSKERSLNLGGTNTRFTIPTAAGPVVVEKLQSYVTMRAGGYFFLPSRSAIEFLLNCD
jgi:Dyp-type peroxidase family